MPSGSASDGGEDEAAEHAPDRHADVLREAQLGEQRPARASIVSGSARKVFETKPPKVATRPDGDEDDEEGDAERERAPGATGQRLCADAALPASLDELRVGELASGRAPLDHAGLEQQVGRFLAEGGVLAGEELLVRGAVLPAQVGLAFSNASPVCLTSAPMISKLFFGSS